MTSPKRDFFEHVKTSTKGDYLKHVKTSSKGDHLKHLRTSRRGDSLYYLTTDDERTWKLETRVLSVLEESVALEATIRNTQPRCMFCAHVRACVGLRKPPQFSHTCDEAERGKSYASPTQPSPQPMRSISDAPSRPAPPPPQPCDYQLTLYQTAIPRKVRCLYSIALCQ